MPLLGDVGVQERADAAKHVGALGIPKDAVLAFRVLDELDVPVVPLQSARHDLTVFDVDIDVFIAVE